MVVKTVTVVTAVTMMTGAFHQDEDGSSGNGVSGRGVVTPVVVVVVAVVVAKL